jgi:hypothetical protein
MNAGIWEFIGECYLYEMMDGQVLSGVDNSLQCLQPLSLLKVEGFPPGRSERGKFLHS